MEACSGDLNAALFEAVDLTHILSRGELSRCLERDGADECVMGDRRYTTLLNCVM